MALHHNPWTSPVSTCVPGELTHTQKKQAKAISNDGSSLRSTPPRSLAAPQGLNLPSHSKLACRRPGLQRLLASAEPNQQTESRLQQESTDAERDRDAQEALQALDKQLAQLAEGGGGSRRTPIPRVGDTLLPSAPGEDRFRTAAERLAAQQSQPSSTLLGRDSNPDGWPEFDASFFTYSSVLLLLVTALSNWVYTSVFNPGTDSNGEISVERQEKRARIQALYDRVALENASSAPPISMKGRE